MKKLLTVMAFSVGLFANAQTGNFFKPVKEVALRTPSVPIVVSDPHFSIWSPYDKLMEGFLFGFFGLFHSSFSPPVIRLVKAEYNQTEHASNDEQEYG